MSLRRRQKLADALQSFLDFCAHLVIPGTLVALVMAALLLPSSCSAEDKAPVSRSIFDQNFTAAPHLTFVTVSVKWSTPEEILEVCGPGAFACGTVGKHNGDLVYMWIPKPRSFSDRLVCAVGHELIHNLGGTHR